MRTPLRLGPAAVAAAVLVATASAASPAAPFHLERAGGAAYPDRAFILTLPYAKALTRTDVTVKENGQRVPGVSVTRSGTANDSTAVVILIDESLTMAGKPIRDAFNAAKAFARTINPNEQVGVVTFNGKVNVLQSLTNDPKAVDDALAKPPEIAYGTKNYDALETALGMIQKSGVQSGSVIILTDGQNVGSTVTPQKALGDLSKARVRVFSVGLFSPKFHPAALQNMASSTGGRYALATTSSTLKPILVALGRELSNEYLLTYKTLQNPRTHVDVAVTVKGVPGVATTSYRTPALHLRPVGVYKRSVANRYVQSTWTMLAVALIFAALVGFAVSRFASKRRDPLVDRVMSFLVKPGAPLADQAEEKPARRSLFLNRLGTATSRSRWSERLAAALELADIEAEPIQVVVLAVIGTVLAVFILGLAFGPIAALVGLSVPLIVRYYVLRRIARKRRVFQEQLPDNLEVLASALRAGHSLVSALNVVARDAIEPSKSEFRRVLAEEQFGAPLEDALQVAVVRMQSRDLDQVALVARLQRDVGSNSAEVLDRVTETVRGRMEIRRLVRTLTAQGRMSRWVLTALPIFLLLVLTLIGGSYMSPMFHRPLGQVLLVVSAILVALGSWVIGKIVDIRIP
jgi:tight adherence protein B